jgi:hypothetical protein
MEDDLKKSKKWKTTSKKKRNQSTKINLIGCDTIVNSPSLDYSVSLQNKGRWIQKSYQYIYSFLLFNFFICFLTFFCKFECSCSVPYWQGVYSHTFVNCTVRPVCCCVQGVPQEMTKVWDYWTGQEAESKLCGKFWLIDWN